jgi:hypothetical protein
MFLRPFMGELPVSAAATVVDLGRIPRINGCANATLPPLRSFSSNISLSNIVSLSMGGRVYF